MRGLSSNQIISIAFFLTAIFISLALTGVPALISNRDAEMPSFYREGMTKKEAAAAAAKTAAKKPPPIPKIKTAGIIVKCAPGTERKTPTDICRPIEPKTKSVQPKGITATKGRQGLK